MQSFEFSSHLNQSLVPSKRVPYLRGLTPAHNLPMLPWKLLTNNEAKACSLSNASIRWTNAFGSYHATGSVEIQCVPGTPGLFRIFIDGASVLWNKDGTKQQGLPIKHCLYLPSDGGYWKVSTHKVKSVNRPDNKAFAVGVEFPLNTDAISFLQVSIQVTGPEELANGARFVEGITYASTSVDRPVATGEAP
jgi:hypothetical protein